MLLVDSNEPDEIVKLLQQSCPVVVSPLNQMHMSDYFFGSYDGTTFQFSRKQAPELLGNLDEAEDQLRDYYDKAEVNYQIVEGYITPHPLKDIPMKDRTPGKLTTRPQPTIFSYQVMPDGSLKGSAFSTLHTISILYAWMHRLDRAGITTYWTMNWIETARLLSAIYRNEQKPPEEHSTLQRVIKPRLQVREAEAFLKALMFLSSAYRLGIGETKAKALCERFVNILDLALAEPEEIAECEGVGKIIAKKLLTALGRTLGKAE